MKTTTASDYYKNNRLKDESFNLPIQPGGPQVFDIDYCLPSDCTTLVQYKQINDQEKVMHCSTGPAMVQPGDKEIAGVEYYLVHGRLHRIGGPAIVYERHTCTSCNNHPIKDEYYLHGIQYSFNQYYNHIPFVPVYI